MPVVDAGDMAAAGRQNMLTLWQRERRGRIRGLVKRELEKHGLGLALLMFGYGYAAGRPRHLPFSQVVIAR